MCSRVTPENNRAPTAGSAGRAAQEFGGLGACGGLHAGATRLGGHVARGERPWETEPPASPKASSPSPVLLLPLGIRPPGWTTKPSWGRAGGPSTRTPSGGCSGCSPQQNKEERSGLGREPPGCPHRTGPSPPVTLRLCGPAGIKGPIYLSCAK